MTSDAIEPAFPEHTCTSGALIREAARRHRDRRFVVLGGETLTYVEAEARSSDLARGLLASGAGKGTRVGLLAPNGPAWVIGWLGATRIGAVVTLLNTYDKERELAWVLRHADVQVLLTVDRHIGHDYVDRLERAAPDLVDQQHESIGLTSHPFLRSVFFFGDVDRPWAGAVDDLTRRGDGFPMGVFEQAEDEVVPADPMVVVYSSGSTADPKGAVHTHGATVRHAHNLGRFRHLAPDDVIYTPMPLFWVGGLSYTLVAALHAGATLVFEERFDPGPTLDLIERERVTHVVGWPHMGKALANHPSFAGRDLSAIRGGSLVDLLPEHLRPGPGRVRANSLGMTETLGPHTIDDAETFLPDDKAGSFGRSVPGLEHRIVDPVTGDDVEPGATGEVWVRGYSVMAGLHKRERSDVFTPDGWYRTGDGGYFDADGHFYFTGRLGQQIKASGMNVTPREVEVELEAEPEVAMAFVVGVPHPERGQDVVAAVLLEPGADVDGDALRARVRERIASYKVPRRIVPYRDRAAVPWLDSGKPDIRRIQAMLADGYDP